jgi:hypothetical protein
MDRAAEEILVSRITSGRLDGQCPPAGQGIPSRLQEVVVGVNVGR